ncbi:MAG: peptidylprolyl isomerase [Bacillota bacterium]|nr:peptidylprolyl isomerase [Bacillota bacterium]
MSETSKAPEKWKSEQLRAERKARLARMKSKEGGKKQIKTSNPLTRLIVIAVLIVALLLTGLWAVVRNGVPQRQLTAVTIGTTDIKAVDVNYYYYQQLSNYGLDPTDPESQATLKAASGIEGFKTNADYLKDQAIQALRQDVMLADQAAKNQMTLTAENEALIDTYLTNLQSTAIQEGKTLDNYLISTFGPGMNIQALRRSIERLLLADQYAAEKVDSFTFNEDELQAGYEKAPEEYDSIDYRIFYLAADIKTGATDAEKTKAMEEARKKADEMLSRITDGDSFRQLCIEYAAEADQVTYRTEDASLMEHKLRSAVTITTHKNWLFDAERKSGDKTVLDSTSGYYVILFQDRSRPEYERVNVRHILITADRETATSEQIETAKKKAESILAEYLAGDKTDEAFAALAKANTADSNAEQGGLYEGVYRGQMVKEFENWCFDPSRKIGDTGIVQTDFGFHVMYYAGQSGVDWILNVTNTLKGEAYQEYLAEEAKNYAYSTHAFGYRFVG